MIAEICSVIIGVFILALIVIIFRAFSQVFIRLYKETIDGIKNRKQDKKRLWVSIGVICWLILCVWYIIESV